MVNLKSKLKQVQKQKGALLVMNLVIIALCLVLFWNHSYVPAIKRRLFPSCEDQLDGE